MSLIVIGRHGGGRVLENARTSEQVETGKLDRAHQLCHQRPPKTWELNQKLPRSRKPFAYNTSPDVGSSGNA